MIAEQGSTKRSAPYTSALNSADQQAEAARTRGTPVTHDSFAKWRKGFVAELKTKRDKEEEDRVRALAPREREDYKKKKERPTGKLQPFRPACQLIEKASNCLRRVRRSQLRTRLCTRREVRQSTCPSTRERSGRRRGGARRRKRRDGERAWSRAMRATERDDQGSGGDRHSKALHSYASHHLRNLYGVIFRFIACSPWQDATLSDAC